MSKILDIYTIKDRNQYKFLRTPSVEVTKEELKSEEFKTFLEDFVHTAKKVETEEGYIAGGLAAVQVGKAKRVFCILRDYGDSYEIMINPEIEVVKPLQVIGLEGCLSIPNTEGKVPRFKKIRVSYLNEKGERVKKNFSDHEARAIQHEYDHLEGVLFTDKLVD